MPATATQNTTKPNWEKLEKDRKNQLQETFKNRALHGSREEQNFMVNEAAIRSSRKGSKDRQKAIHKNLKISSEKSLMGGFSLGSSILTGKTPSVQEVEQFVYHLLMAMINFGRSLHNKLTPEQHKAMSEGIQNRIHNIWEKAKKNGYDITVDKELDAALKDLEKDAGKTNSFNYTVKDDGKAKSTNYEFKKTDKSKDQAKNLGKDIGKDVTKNVTKNTGFNRTPTVKR